MKNLKFKVGDIIYRLLDEQKDKWFINKITKINNYTYDFVQIAGWRDKYNNTEWSENRTVLEVESRLLTDDEKVELL